MNEEQMNEEQTEEESNLEEQAERELKFSSRQLLLEIQCLLKDFFLLSNVMLLGGKILLLKFYNGQVFEIKLTEKNTPFSTGA